MNRQRQVSSAVFVGIIVVLLILATAGFGLYLTRPTVTTTVTSTEEMSAANTFSFVAATGQMFHGGWAVVGTTSAGQYLISVHAEGLETTAGSGYILEGKQASGSITPVGANATASEFDAGPNGVANVFFTVSQNPLTAYDNLQIIFLPGMVMANATVVATATLPMGH